MTPHRAYKKSILSFLLQSDDHLPSALRLLLQGVRVRNAFKAALFHHVDSIDT